MDAVVSAAKLDWSSIDPSIFGTLFERGLDPSKRSQLGAHYTSRQDIETLIEPVVMAPLRREWEDVRSKADGLLAQAAGKGAKKSTAKADPRNKARKLVKDFLERLGHVTVLDPACGSGNFLYVVLQKLLDLEKKVLGYLHSTLQEPVFPRVTPRQLYGIEISPYAFDLAQLSVWIGYLQWVNENGYGLERTPVLDPLDTFENKDAILDLSDPQNPREPTWPKVEFIVGNPPFLGGNKIRAELGNDYVDSLFSVFEGRVPHFADLCCYWFEKSREMLGNSHAKRAGLLATQGIRGGANREVLSRIVQGGQIFFAISDRKWILDGAAVHISMVGFDMGAETHIALDGAKAAKINPNLSSMADTTTARRLSENQSVCFMGASKKGPFDISFDRCSEWLHESNPDGRPNSDVITPWFNGLDVTRRDRFMWIIDFGADAGLHQVAFYEMPFKYTVDVVKQSREKNQKQEYRGCWWLHGRPRVEMRESLSTSSRWILTPAVAKHRVFIWSALPTLPDQQLLVFAFDDDYHFGVLHSRAHEVWALKLGTQLETRPRYTPTSCFETFAFPEPTDKQREAIAAAAKELDRLRSNWLNPPEWTTEEILTFPGSVDGPWKQFVHDPNAKGIGTVRYPRLVPKDDECAKKLAKRTLTNLYNERPTWLDLAHKRLDEAVFAAYGWPADLTDEQILERLLKLNLEREPAKGKTNPEEEPEE